MYFDIQAGSHDCFTVMYVIFISVPHTIIICDMRVNKVMFSSVQFNMDEVDPLIIHDCIKIYLIEVLKLTEEVYQ